MSHEERRTWAYAAVAAVVPAVYAAVMLGRLSDAGAEDVPYVRPLLLAAGAGAILAG